MATAMNLEQGSLSNRLHPAYLVLCMDLSLDSPTKLSIMARHLISTAETNRQLETRQDSKWKLEAMPSESINPPSVCL